MSSTVCEVPTPQPLSNVADCILHGEHHYMTEACWEAVIPWFLTGEDMAFSVKRDRYKWHYERAALAAVLKEVGHEPG